MAQPPLMVVRAWQEKSADVVKHSKDRLLTAVNKGFDAMSAVLQKDSDPEDVQCALEYLSFESSLALKFEKAKEDPLREVVYGLLESLHVSLNEWTEERNQKKETEEMSKQTEEVSTQSLVQPLIPRFESSLPIDNDISNSISNVINPSSTIPMEPIEKSIDIHQSLPSDYQISASELMRDEKTFKEEEMDNENKEGITDNSRPIFPDSLDLLDKSLNFTPSLPFNSVPDPTDISQILPRDNRMLELNSLGDEMDFKEEEAPKDDVNSGMGDAVGESHGLQFNEDDSDPRMIQPTGFMDYQMNFDDEISGDLPLTEKNSINEGAMSIENGDETAQADIDGKDQFDLPANDMTDNGGEEEKANGDPTDTQKGTSETTIVEKRGRPSRNVSRPVHYNDSMDDSDGEVGQSVKKSRSDSTRKADNKRRSAKFDYESESASKKTEISKMNDTDLECPECEYRTRNVNTWTSHLRYHHDTTPTLAGLAFLCECGNESLSYKHSRACDRGNITVIRKRDGPILRLEDGTKPTVQCVLCEIYPKTTGGYAKHLHRHHNSTLAENGIYLICSCGLEVRSNNGSLKHFNECNPREFTLHKLDDE